tara:strand:+ start:32 stop:364 length:333 start_codon:yes stop_codon:yes gene_type:complete
MINFISHYHLYIIGFLILFSILSVYFTIKFAIIILKTEEKLTNILDAIDEEYMEISKVLETPIFFDSQEVKQVMSSINNVRNTFLNISAYIIEDYKDSDDQTNEENQADN